MAMARTEQQRRQHYQNVLHTFRPLEYTRSMLAHCPTGNLRCLCVHHGLPVEAGDQGKTPPRISVSPQRLAEALEWWSKQGRPAAPDLDAWMPPTLLGEQVRPFVPPPIRALTPQEEDWLPVPFLKT